MRIVKIACAAALVLGANGGMAMAFENFIPLGTGYSTENSSVADLNTDTDKIIVQSDIYETEIYLQDRDARVQDSYINRFISNPESTGGDFDIDY
jgi:hypothetical protein